MKSLTLLNIAQNMLTNVESMNSNSLVTLFVHYNLSDLSFNSFQGQPPSLDKLPSLESLVMSNCKFSGVMPSLLASTLITSMFAFN